ncbi:MAG: hypothetical protein UH641_03150 [Bacteroidales bacterium]|nr:hypothetical protein [Bacteroidales bacterium]
MTKIIKCIFGIFFLFSSSVIVAQTNPCKFTEEKRGEVTVYKGEMTYIGTIHEELRIGLQFQMIGDEVGIAISVNNKDGISIDSTNVAYVQLSNDKEYVLVPKEISYTNQNKRLECRYVVSEQYEEDFSSNIITGIYFSTNLHPQIDLSDFNKYTARRLSERFKCACNEIKKAK